MAKHKMTFTLGADAVRSLRRTASRLGRPMSQIVAEAVVEYGERVDRLSELERRRMLAVFDEVVPEIPERPVAEVEREIAAVRAARRAAGRRARR